MQTLYLLDWDWLVHVYYEASQSDSRRILADLRRIGCRGEDYRRAVSNLRNGRPNEGLTYSSPADRESVVIISETTSADEFQDTFDHEKGHLAMHISLAMGINPFSEEFEYLTGAIGKQMFAVARRYLCEHCRKAKRRG